MKKRQKSGSKTSKKRGRPRYFSDLAITTALMMKCILSMPLRTVHQLRIYACPSSITVPTLHLYQSPIIQTSNPRRDTTFSHWFNWAQGLRWRRMESQKARHRRIRIPTQSSQQSWVYRTWLILKYFRTCSRKHTEGSLMISGDEAYDTKDCYNTEAGEVTQWSKHSINWLG